MAKKMTGNYSCRCSVAETKRKKAKAKKGKRKTHKKFKVGKKVCSHPSKYKKCVARQMGAYMSSKRAKAKCRKAFC